MSDDALEGGGEMGGGGGGALSFLGLPQVGLEWCLTLSYTTSVLNWRLVRG